MDTQRKIEEIREAIASGVPKRRLDVRTNGTLVTKILSGVETRTDRVDYAYENLLAHRRDPNQYRNRLKTFEDHLPEISQSEKIRRIKKASESGLANRRIDWAGNGLGVKRLFEGKVSSAKINEMYANLLAYEETQKSLAKGKKRSNRKSSHSQNKPSQKASVEKRLEKLEKQVNLLEKIVLELRDLLSAKAKKEPLKMLGITVTQKTDKIAGREYKRWYGIYREKGKIRWIYIGKDLARGPEKIKAWVQKHGKSLP